MRRMSSRTIDVALPVALGALCLLFFSYLLARFSYDGLYGQDTYAYFYQAEALWSDLLGRPRPEGTLAGTDSFRWPIGYHLHIIAGFIFSAGPQGGRAITVLLAAAAPVLVYLIVQALWTGAAPLARRAAGLAAALLLVLNGTYTRFGLSLMSDVPALFWSLLALLLFLKAWPPDRGEDDQGTRRFLAVGAGIAFGIAVMVRYGSALLVVPVFLYILLRRYQSPDQRSRGEWGKLAWLGAGTALALLPQVIYLLAHPSGSGYSAFLGDWNLANIFSTTTTSADGTATYEYPMIAFYAAGPLASSSMGFLSPFLVPAFALGAGVLARERRWPQVALLAAWWLVPALFFSGTPYQSHRFVVSYLPALTITVGIGLGWALGVLLPSASRLSGPRWALALAAGLLLVAFGGAAQGWLGAERWVGIHSSFKSEEAAVIALAGEAAGGATPRVLSLGMTAAINHYTRWPVLDIYNHDEQEIEAFFQGSDSKVVVLPEDSMDEQWAGTPTGRRWEWVRATYRLEQAGRAGAYTVYRVMAGPPR